jgi:hypothetical protein
MPSARVIWFALTRVLLFAVLFMVGCMAPRYGETAAAPGSYDYEAGGGSTTGYATDGVALAEEGMAAGMGGVMDMRREYAGDEAPPPAPPAEPAAQPSPTPVLTPPTDLPKQTDQPKPVAGKRQVIYTATMQVRVYDLEHSIEQAEALPDRFGGWLHQRIDNQLVLRIPAEHLEEAMDIIAELGVVDLRLLSALDVTAEYTDLESRIKVLVEMQAQLKKLLAQAKNVEQALEIRRALDEITMELEVARARMRELAKSIAFSTLIVQFVARGPDFAVPSSNDPFPWVVELGVEATEFR